MNEKMRLIKAKLLFWSNFKSFYQLYLTFYISKGILQIFDDIKATHEIKMQRNSVHNLNGSNIFLLDKPVVKIASRRIIRSHLDNLPNG